MDRRVSAAYYALSVLIGLAAAWVVCQSVLLAVSKGPPGPHAAAPFIFIGTLLVVYAALGAIFAFVLPTRSWILSGVSVGSPGVLLYAFCWWSAGPTRMLITDLFPLAVPLFAACIGAYVGSLLRRPREVISENSA